MSFKEPGAALKRINYALSRRMLAAWAAPTVNGAEALAKGEAAAEGDVVYALPNRSTADLALLDIVAERNGLASPRAPLERLDEAQRFFFLAAPAGLWRRNVMRTVPSRLRRVEEKLAASAASSESSCGGQGASRLWLVPVSIFWGRAANKDRSWTRSLLSEGWAMSSRLRRLVIFVFTRRDILVQIGEPLAWDEMAKAAPRPPRGETPAVDDGDDGALLQDRASRRTARLLRAKFRNQKVAALGPDLSHRRTLVRQILNSAQVAAAIAAESGNGGDGSDGSKGKSRQAAEKRARKAAFAIAADMSYPTVRFLDRLLAWFWSRVYEGIDIHGMEIVVPIAQTHTLVYVPCHRSHIDYLLLSYVLYQQGLMLPHIAAGDNLDMPLVGGLLRGGGAFFMRRRFRSDRVYAAVFTEYLYQVFRRGHSVEYFVEGGRSRTGRLLPARTGLLQMTLDAHRRGLPRPVAFIPVYFGYEKLVEASGYVDEMRGADKKNESIGDILRSLKLVRQSFGAAQVSFGAPLVLDDFLRDCDEAASPVKELGARILRGINACAAVNGMNLIALATLSMPRHAIEEGALVAQIDLYRDLLRRDAAHHRFAVADAPAQQIVERAERLGLLKRERATGAPASADGGEQRAQRSDILLHDAFTAVLTTWYRNNVLHVLAAPALIACLIVNRRRGIAPAAVKRLFDLVFPHVRNELKASPEDSAERWLAHLQDAQVVALRGDGLVAPTEPALRLRLRLLANTVMEVLERFYIGLSLLQRAGSGVLDRRELLLECRATAARISTLYGINAPEFADGRLFEGFVAGLIEQGAILEGEDGKLNFDGRINAILRPAKSTIALELRQALETMGHGL